MLLCRSVFSDQRKTPACLRVTAVLEGGRGVYRLVVTACMLCVCGDARAVRGVLVLECSQMETASLTGRATIVWSSSASLHLISTNASTCKGGQMIYL